MVLAILGTSCQYGRFTLVGRLKTCYDTRISISLLKLLTSQGSDKI